MEKRSLDEMDGGWFVGDFEPSCLRTKEFEVALKRYEKGQSEARHVHRIAKEITLIAQGRVLMGGEEYKSGDIVVVEPGDCMDFHVIEDTLTVVVKIPSIIGDKYRV